MSRRRKLPQRNRSRCVSVRFSPSEYGELVNKAMACNCSLSALVRNCCLDSRKEVSPRTTFQVADALREAALELGKMSLEFQQSGDTSAVHRLNRLVNRLEKLVS